MKKILFYVSSVAMLLFAAGCQKEMAPGLDGDANVTFTVSTGEMATKAIADGKNVNELLYEIWNGDFTKKLGRDSMIENDADKTFTVKLRLVAGQKYNIIFWAQVKDAGHYDVTELKEVKINDYSDDKANDETRAAFFAVHTFTTDMAKPIKETVYLKRPFAQLNLGTSRLDTSLNQVDNGNIKVTTTTVEVTSIATSFNTVEGVGVGEQVVKFVAAATPNGWDGEDGDEKKKHLEVEDETYHWLGMNYLIVKGDKDVVTVKATVVTNLGTVNHTIHSVPVQENYRTNLIGDFLVTGAEFKVIVDEKFLKDDYLIPVNKEVVLATAADLVWFQKQVNNGNTFSGQTVRLGADIDLDGATWTPINEFKGTFDGSKLTKAAADNYTISNFVVNGTSCAGLFGSVTGDIKNVNIKNATVTANKYAGSLVGYIYGNVENCHADNVKVTVVPALNGEGKYDDGDDAGGLIGYICAEPASSIVSCTVSNSKVVAYRDLGGLAGTANIGANATMTVMDNTVSNTFVVANQLLDAEYAEAKPVNSGVIIGNPIYGEVDASNVVDAGGVSEAKTTTAEALAEDVNEAGAVVALPAGEYTFPSKIAANVTINCAEGTVFEGKSSLNINGSTVVGATFSRPEYEANSGAASGSINGTFKDCVFTGANALRYCYAGETVVFENCVFSGDVYGVHFDGGANDVIFRNCTFSGFNAFGGALTLVTFDGCTFQANKTSGYNGVNLWGSARLINTEFTFDGSVANEWVDAIGTDKTYEFEGCTVNGSEEGIYNKDFIFSRNDATDIKINGVLYEDYMTCTVPDAEK